MNNSAGYGGGIDLSASNTGTGTNATELTSLTVNKNTAAIAGGGVYLDVLAAPSNTLKLDNNIFDGNLVTAAGYIGPLDVTMAAGTVPNMEKYNLVGTSDAAMFPNLNDIKNNAPGLAVALAANGALPGYPKTLALSVTSPGYQSGDQFLAGRAGPWGIDEGGLTRQFDPFNNRFVSIGAFDPDAI